MRVNAVIPAHLHLVCRKCTREAGFAGGTREEAEATAKRAGWIMREQVICPNCPAVRPLSEKSDVGIVIGTEEYRRAVEALEPNAIPEGVTILA